MATVQTPNKSFSSPEEVGSFLKEKGIIYHQFSTPESLGPLLSQGLLSDAEKEEVLSGLEYRFDQLKKDFGYKARDLVVLHESVPGIQEMLAKFDKLHYHSDEEVRFIIDGSGIFGFSIAGENFEVHVSKGDFISIPQNTNHWFTLDKALRIKAVRYFKDNSGWTPIYVNQTASAVG